MEKTFWMVSRLSFGCRCAFSHKQIQERCVSTKKRAGYDQFEDIQNVIKYEKRIKEGVWAETFVPLNALARGGDRIKCKNRRTVLVFVASISLVRK